MKSFLVIGMGKFGRHLAKKLVELGNDVLVIDKDAVAIEQISPFFDDVQLGDCTNENVLATLGVEHFDKCFVAIGEDFQSSLVVTSLLKTLGATYVVSKAKQNIQASLLKKIGADEVVCPDNDTAEKLAVRHNAGNIFDYIELTDEYSIYEIPVFASWIDKSISAIDIRKKYRINIIAVKNSSNGLLMPGPDYVFRSSDHVVIMGKSDDVFKLTEKQ